jgi:hypothetical protein
LWKILGFFLVLHSHSQKEALLLALAISFESFFERKMRQKKGQCQWCEDIHEVETPAFSPGDLYRPIQAINY